MQPLNPHFCKVSDFFQFSRCQISLIGISAIYKSFLENKNKITFEKKLFYNFDSCLDKDSFHLQLCHIYSWVLLIPIEFSKSIFTQMKDHIKKIWFGTLDLFLYKESAPALLR